MSVVKLLVDERLPKNFLNKITKIIPKDVFFAVNDDIFKVAKEEIWNLVIMKVDDKPLSKVLEQFAFARAFIFFSDMVLSNELLKELRNLNGTSEMFIDVNPKILELSIKNAIKFIEKSEFVEELISEKRFYNLFTNFQGPKIRKFILRLKELFNVYQDIALLSEKGCKREDFCNYVSNGEFLLFDLDKIPEPSIYFKIFEEAEKTFRQIGNKVIFLDNFDNSSGEFQKNVYKLMLKRFHKNGEKKVDFFGRILLGINENNWENNIIGDIKNLLGKAILRIPPLRERVEDIPYMIDHIIAIYSSKLKKTVSYPSNEIIEFLKNYNWPGNFEEFENLMTEFVIAGNENNILKHAIDKMTSIENIGIKGLPKLRDITKKVVSQIEKDLINRALEMTSKNKKKASKLLGISYKTFVQKMKKHGIK